MPDVIGYPADIKASHGDTVRRARDLLSAGQEFRQERQKAWKKSTKQYEGKHWSPSQLEDPTADLTVVNVSFGTVNTILPNITGQEPHFSVQPFSADATETNASKQESFLNRLWRHQPVGAQAALRAATFDRVVKGDGFCKVTWAIKERVRGGADELVEYAEINVDKVSPWDVWIDQYATSLNDARWVAHRIWFTREQVEEDERYNIPKDFSFTDRRDDGEDDGIDHTNVTQPDGEEHEWVEMIEFYDIDNETLIVFPKASGSPSDLPWQAVDGITCPIVQIPGYQLDFSPYHMSDLEQIYGLQMELNKTRSELMTHRRRNKAKIFVKVDALTDEAKDALASATVGEFVPLKTDQPLENIVRPMQLAPIASENYASSSQIQDDIREITGVTEYQRGTAPDITRTATEASMMDASANAKLQSQLSRVEEAARRLGMLVLGIAAAVYPQTDVDEMAMWIGGDDARRTTDLAIGDEASALEQQGDMEGAAAMSSMTGQMSSAILTPNEDMFTGEYEVLVTTGSTEYRNPKIREEKYEQLFFSLLQAYPTLQQAGVNVDLSAVLRLYLEAADVSDVDKILAPGAAQPPPITPEAPPGMEPAGAGGQAAPQGGDPMAALMGMMGPGSPEVTGATPENSGMLEDGMISEQALV